MNNPKASILSIGDEILIGETENTNTTFIAQKLYGWGFNMISHISVGDDEQSIHRALDVLIPTIQLVICTGGLGPTSDDITLTALNRYFGGKIYENVTVKAWLECFVKERGLEYNKLNKLQSLISTKSKPIRNNKGTATGLVFEKNECVLVALPGVPYEMKAFMEEGVKQFIDNRFVTTKLKHEYVYTAGIQESQIAIRLENIEFNIDNKKIKIAYLPKAPKKVKIRLSLLDIKAQKELIKVKQLIEKALDSFVVNRF